MFWATSLRYKRLVLNENPQKGTLTENRLGTKCYFCGMFVEKKLNKSGSTSVRVMQKLRSKHKCVKVLGYSSEIEGIGLLVKRGNRWIEEQQSGEFLFELEDEASAYDKVLADLRRSQLRLIGRKLYTVSFNTSLFKTGFDCFFPHHFFEGERDCTA